MFELNNAIGLVVGLMNKINARSENDWEEVWTKNILKWYMLAKDGTGVERYVWSV